MSVQPIEEAPLEWSGNADWTATDDRTGVVTQDYGQRSRHEIELGIDPENSVLYEHADHYWPLEEDPEADDNYTTDEIGDADAIYKNDPRSAISGAHGTNAPNFNGNDTAVGFGSAPVFDEFGGGFTFAAFIDTEDDRNFRTIFHTARPWDAEGAILIQKHNQRISVEWRDGGEWVGYDNFHAGEFTFSEPHSLLVSARPGNQTLVDVWFDGERESQIIDSIRPQLDSNDNYGAIGAIWYDNFRWMSGVFDDIIYSTAGVDRNLANYYHNAYSEGYLLTNWKNSEYRAYEVTIDCDIPDPTELQVNIVQDYSNDLSDYNYQTIFCDPGENTYQLTDFQERSARWRTEFILRTDDPYYTPTARSAELGMESIPPTGVWDTSNDGTIITDDGTILTV